VDIEPTGKQIKMQFSDFWLIKDGKFSENFVMVDNYSVLQQMGITFK
jgi:predicted ester cyclase